MPQLITKYNTAARAMGLEADALLDPKSAYRYFVDFCKDKSNDEFTVNTGVSAASFVYENAHGGSLQINTASGAGTTGGWGSVASPQDFIVLDHGRRVFFDTRFTFNSLSQTSFCVGLTSATGGANSLVDGSGLVTGGGSAVRSILIGRDSGTPSLPGANTSNTLRNLQLWIKDTAGAATEIVLPLSETLVAAGLPYTFTLAIQGWTVQPYFNGKRLGNPVRIGTQFTEAMGGLVFCANEAEISKTYRCDYIEVVGTR